VEKNVLVEFKKSLRKQTSTMDLKFNVLFKFRLAFSFFFLSFYFKFEKGAKGAKKDK
jgi:hypothetical protein